MWMRYDSSSLLYSITVSKHCIGQLIIMFTRLIYKLTHVIIDEVKIINDYNVAFTFEENNGYFDYERDAESFIVKHKNDLNNYNGFYIIEAWVKEPTHVEQCFTPLFIKTLDKDGEIICYDLTYRFIPNQHDALAENDVKFCGRDNVPFKKNDIGWFYDWTNNCISPCKISELPFNTEQAKQYENLEYMDDSYLVYPLPIPEYDNHEHIQSCFMFTDDMFKKMIENNDEKEQL